MPSELLIRAVGYWTTNFDITMPAVLAVWRWPPNKPLALMKIFRLPWGPAVEARGLVTCDRCRPGTFQHTTLQFATGTCFPYCCLLQFLISPFSLSFPFGFLPFCTFYCTFVFTFFAK